MIRDSETLNHTLSALNRFIKERLVPIEEQVDREGVIPEPVVDEMRALGLGGLTMPARYGGSELTIEEKIRFSIAFGWTSPAFCRRFTSNDGPGFALMQGGTEEQRAYWLPKLASGELTGSFAMTEPEAGSDAGGIRTRAQRDGGEYVLNGTKRFITNAPFADVFIVTARTGLPADGAKGVSSFLVPATTPGLKCGPPDSKMGLNGNDTADVTFDECRVPVENLIGAEGEGFKIFMRRLDIVRVEAAAVAVGNAERLIHEATQYALTRSQFGQPIAHYQLVQAMLADSQAEMYAAKCMVIDAAQKLDDGQPTAMEAASCKLFATEMVGRVADRAVQIHGGSGYMRGTAVERFYRDVRVYRIYDGTSQVQKLIIARNLLKRARQP